MIRKDYNQTWLLIGMYIDYCMAGKCEAHEKMKKKLWKKIKIRWDKGIDRDAFDDYFETWNITKDKLNL